MCDARTIEMDVSSKAPPPPLARSPSPAVAGEAGKRRIYKEDDNGAHGDSRTLRHGDCIRKGDRGGSGRADPPHV